MVLGGALLVLGGVLLVVGAEEVVVGAAEVVAGALVVTGGGAGRGEDDDCAFERFRRTPEGVGGQDADQDGGHERDRPHRDGA
ncbi:hypothetical protein FHX42_000014 [Saccharopolyspora lacisalsi]|uniref:Uncharacterized protein n=1 Tax=Halosaccharopolyspora lacisalsi TaxID=1000566 RepID=A0A839DTU3_9PSEU|nr:hypothetical protein [Halosaccharopolyspora lacisalsi]MBA8822685.1 hypothetical protein [Halosaccharopolyspora lacisalsi]